MALSRQELRARLAQLRTELVAELDMDLDLERRKKKCHHEKKKHCKDKCHHEKKKHCKDECHHEKKKHCKDTNYYFFKNLSPGFILEEIIGKSGMPYGPVRFDNFDPETSTVTLSDLGSLSPGNPSIIKMSSEEIESVRYQTPF
ncbi:hypothetical protein ABET51_11630 [Metabacillus fastidiosus]|uniref:hypothetical protein n=1 Tax=Metabacillus fastidiosus TaxID=1458 RepID=UPI002E1A3423|nr:hypothetical protein [Metabacillus fastidiosus]